MKRVSFYLVVLMVTMVAFSSCKKQGDGVIAYSIKADGFEDRITWDSCVTNISGLSFVASLKHDDINNQMSGTAKSVHFLSSSSLPYSNGNLDPGKYKDVKVIINYKKSILNPPLMLFGTYHNNSGHPVRIEVYLNENMDVAANGNDFSLDKDEHIAGSVTINLQALMSTISNTELNDAIVNKKIIISLDPNKHLYDKMIAKLPESISVNF